MNLEFGSLGLDRGPGGGRSVAEAVRVFQDVRVVLVAASADHDGDQHHEENHDEEESRDGQFAC